MDQKQDDFVKVSLRIRPPMSELSSANSCLQVISTQPPVLMSIDKQQTYYFDNIFNEESDQEVIYNDAVRHLVEMVKEGYNCTVFAYGQTGTGKTYTIGTNPFVKDPEEDGLISRALNDFFDFGYIKGYIDIYVSFIEIYNEKVYNLLPEDEMRNKEPLSVKGFRVEGITKKKVYSALEAKDLLQIGVKNRHTAETKQNVNSSRSHAIFTIYCDFSSIERTTSAKLNFVDLAGSESVKKTGSIGSTFHEGVNINRGLLCIGQVMKALSSNATHIPYRQSIITTILQDSLNKRNYVSLIACVKSSSVDSTETTQTLEFARRVKKIKNKPEVNQVVSQFKKDNPSLFERSSLTIQTPLKKNIITPSKYKFRTPMAQVPLSTIIEQEKPDLVFESPKSLNSSPCGSSVSQNLSPVLRKYINDMENSIVDKLKTVIHNTLRRSTRLSTRNSDKENTPKYTLKEMKSKVTQLVREEILQYTGKITRATSSPIEQNERMSIVPKKILEYDSPGNNTFCSIEGDSRVVLNENDDTIRNIRDDCKPVFNENEINSDVGNVFKKPLLPIRPPKRPNTDTNDTFKRRRSQRLSLKKAQDLIPAEDIPFEPQRRSVRLSIKLSNEKLEKMEKGRPIIKKLPTVKLGKMDGYKNSPLTKRTNFVLNILNIGSKKDITKLPTIGVKTAERIVLYREINGCLKSVSDLSNLPGWSTTYYQKFLDQNFLKV